MWYPTKIQWLVIWLSCVVGLLFVLANDPKPQALIVPCMMIGALFLWQATGSPEDTE
jgi:uncharacterized membrane protein YphA (DoxX/SURF4 family)